MATEQNPRKEAAEALIQWATTCMGGFTMRNKVEAPLEASGAYLEASGANLPSIGGDAAIIAHRQIAAKHLLLDCITPLTKTQLDRAAYELSTIAATRPHQSRSCHR